MPVIREEIQNLPSYGTTHLTSLPLIYDPEHLYPYASHGANDKLPVIRGFRMVVVENSALRVTVAPELGGRVFSIFDKRIGKEIIFSNPVVKPTRILPVWAYISGGIEFNFPISHSPTSCSTVGCATGSEGDYAFIRVGERELRSGMEWVVELGLTGDEPVLVQRTRLGNRTGRAHPWMMWSNCAVRSTVHTEFVYPDGPAFFHGATCQNVRWPDCGYNWERNIQRMVGLFWSQGQGDSFGVFHHDLGFGLLHVANPRMVPGKKLWSYGMGRHRRWGVLTSDDGHSYAEIQSGPLVDQAQKPVFESAQELCFEEFWIPVHDRQGMEGTEIPSLAMPAEWPDYLGFDHSPWQVEWERFRAGEATLPTSPVPTGLDLEYALRKEIQRSTAGARYALATFLAARERAADAAEVLPSPANPLEHRLLGLILWKGLKQPGKAAVHLENGPLDDPVAVCELDKLYEVLGDFEGRAKLLANAPEHARVWERRANLSLALGKPHEALSILMEHPWQLEHQRYVRSELWRAAQHQLGNAPGSVPESLGEDDLAPFGAYWSE